MLRSTLTLLSAAGLTAYAIAQGTAQKAPVTWSTGVETSGKEVLLKATARIDEGWHVYALTLPSDQGPLPTVFTFSPSTDYALVDATSEPKPEEVEDPNFMMLVRHHSHHPVFVQKAARKGSGAFEVNATVEYMACNNTMCLPPVQVPLVFHVEAVLK